jgi:hypothetical protein
MMQGQGVVVMETPIGKTEEKPLRSFNLKGAAPDLLKYGTVTAFAFSGIGLMMGGGMAWVAGELTMFFACFVAGAIFIATGGMGFLKCLDGKRN